MILYFTVEWVTVILFYSGMGYCDSFTVDWVTVILLHSGMGYCDTILQCISVNKIYAL